MKSNIDSVPCLLSPGEIVCNNEAADLLGREKLVKANKIGLAIRKAKEQKTMKPQKYSGGTLYPQGIPRLGGRFDPGNAPQGVGTAVPGAVRTGNRYSQVPGFVPTDTVRTPQGVYGARYADGNLTPEGIQPPGLMETIKGIFNPSGGPVPAPQAPGQPGQSAPTLDEARANYELQRPQGYANGVRTPQGVGSEEELKAQKDDNEFYQAPVAGLPDIGGALGNAVAKVRDFAGTQANGMRLVRPPGGNPLPDLVGGAQGLAGRAIGGAYDAGGNALDLLRPSVQAAPAPISQAPQAAVAAPQAPPSPATGQPSAPGGINFTDRGGVRTLSGDGFNVSSASPHFGVDPDVGHLGKAIAYNRTQGAKDQFAANAALSQGRYDAARNADAASAESGRRADLERIAMGADFNTQDLGQFVGAQAKAKAARELLGIGLGQQRLDQDQGQFDVSNQTALENARLQAAQKQAELAAPEYIALDQYGEVDPTLGVAPKIGQQLVDKKTGRAAGDPANSQLFAGRAAHPHYNALVQKYGKDGADALFLKKIRDMAG